MRRYIPPYSIDFARELERIASVAIDLFPNVDRPLQSSKERIAELNRQITVLREQEERLLNLRLLDEIEASTYARKSTELRDRIAQLSLQIEACDRGRAEYGELAENVFELSQSLTDKWLSADPRARRRLLDIVCLNFRLDDVTLVPEMRKPFDVLAEGLLLKKCRGDRMPLELTSLDETAWPGHLVRAVNAMH